MENTVEKYRRASDSKGNYRINTTFPGRYRNIRENLMEYCEFEDYDSIELLDIGSSNGRATSTMSIHLSDFYDVEVSKTGIDIENHQLEKARQEENIDYPLKGHSGHLPIQTGSMDIVVCNGLIPFIGVESGYDGENPAYNAMDEIHRVLDEDGIATVHALNGDSQMEKFLLEKEDISDVLESNSPEEELTVQKGKQVEIAPGYNGEDN